MSEELVNNPFSQIEDRQEDQIPSATLAIYEHIGQYLARAESETNVNRASAATMCVRRRWYQANGYKGTPLTPRKIVNFMLGDLTERTLVFFIKQALVGPGKLYSEVNFGAVIGSITFQGKPIEIYAQKTMTWKLEGLEITGHADGFGKRNSDGKWELIEIKSAADYGFDSFIKDGPGDYLKQAHALMMMEESRALNIKQVRFFYLRKNTGNLYDRIFDFDAALAAQVVHEFQIANGKTIPEAPYQLVPETHYKKPTGRMTCLWFCSYCPYLSQCKPGFTKEFKNGKPKYIFPTKEGG